MLISFINVNFWKNIIAGMKFGEKNAFVTRYITDNTPAVVALNEYCSNDKYAQELERNLPNYRIVKPYNFDTSAHTQSLMNLVLVEKSIDITVETVKCSMPNRLNVLNIHLAGNDKPPVHLVNIYMVQTAIVPKHMRFKRERAHDCLWRELTILLKRYEGDPVIVMGDLQETSQNGKNIKKLVNEFGYKEVIAGNYAPVETFDYQTIDHILFSEKAMQLLNPNSYEIDTASFAISDHPMISVSVA